ncbi:hypothetical protein P8452_43628 [Trifolium repens]|nr:hypothetical protein P8452_43628 [Trifolium repens]
MFEARQKFRESWTLDEVIETSHECTTSSTDQKSDSDEATECQLIDNMVVNESTTSDHQDVVHKTTTENTLSPATSVSRPVNLIEPQEQVHLKPLSSVELPHSPIIHLLANKSNHVSMVAEPIEKMQQLPASNLEIGPRTNPLVPPISNMVIDSHVSSVVNAPSSNTQKISTRRVVNDNHPIQTVVQLASRNVPPLCNDSFLNQLETLRKHDEQNVKIRQQMELQLKFNFEKEMKKIHAKFQEQREKTSFLKMMLADAKSNHEFPGTSQMLHLQGFNHILHHLPRQQNATCHSLDSNASSRGRAAATLQNSYASAASHTMVLSPTLQTSYNTSEIFRDFFVRAISSALRNLQVGGEASRLPPYGHSTFIPASCVGGILHGMPSHPATPSCINSISSVSRNLQAGVEIRTTASHLYVPSIFIPTSSVNGIPHGMPSHPTKPSLINSNSLPSEILQDGGEICTAAHIGGVPYGKPSRPAAPSNPPAGYLSSTSLSEWLAKPMLPPMAISKVGTHSGNRQENIGLSPHTHTLSFKDMHMNHNRI